MIIENKMIIENIYYTFRNLYTVNTFSNFSNIWKVIIFSSGDM
jgi:hypothetical protein